jgi:hypothetical protein
MSFLFLFLDGVGLGSSDPTINPLVRAAMPNLQSLLGGRRLVLETAPFHGERASLLALDACLGVGGLPQSATGQAVLLTGLNVPQIIGYHYGPKPNPEVAAFLHNGNLFSRLSAAGRRVAFLNAYPPRYFEAIQSGRRLYSAIPLAVVSAGLPLKTAADLFAGQAISADFTGQGWRTRLGISEAPVLTPRAAGERLAQLAQQVDFSFFEFWPSDYAGHGQGMADAVALLEELDQVIGGLAGAWDDERGLILITSDHGNLEDLSTHRHTYNPAPAVVIGAAAMRQPFIHAWHTLTDVAPAIMRLFE